MLAEERQSLEQLHKRAVKELEEEEKLRAEFEQRKTKELKTLIEEEEKRVQQWREQMR